MIGTVRILTWNVWWRFGPAWRERQEGLLAQLRAADADVVALQECWRTSATSQAHEFASELGLYAAFVAPGLPPPPDPPETPDQAGVEVGIGLLSRWPIERVRAVDLPSRNRTPAPVSLIAQLAHPAGPVHVIAVCLEWEPEYNEDRFAQAASVAELAADFDGPLVVCGDFNAAPDSPILRPVQAVLQDAWTGGGGADDAVTLPSDHPQAPRDVPELIDQRIDHIFFRPAPGTDVTRAALVGEAIAGLHPSDHLGVCCDLVL